jgi:uncharacterized protein
MNVQKGDTMKAVVFYETGSSTMEQIMAVYPRHKVYLDSFVEKGEVYGIGPFAGGREGSMGIFKSREIAEEFVRNDPFVLEGLVGKITIKEWNDSLL